MNLKIHEMNADQLREELKKTEVSLASIFDEAKENPDPELGEAYYFFQNESNRIRNRLWALEVNHA